MRRAGFTLIEMLIVIAILGILVALVLPRFSDVREDSNTKVCVANLRGLASAMTTYETRANTDISWGGSNDVTALVTWGYISDEPFCPYDDGTNPYTLVASSGATPDYAQCPYGPAAKGGDDSHTDHVWP